ncbi:MAG: AtpZ/AtpI family protein [Pelagibacterales bacterium]|jgi:ATP synthase protein I|nr:AtpZ/AtpI family protein [Pelagibacterales bacterium]|tara:strand:- start:728 stop:1015 length:288 start_codon:yes stop_codon:yes gene_type:complete
MQDDEHKLNQLNQKIEAAKSKNQSDSHSSIPPSQLGKVMKLTVEIVAAVGIGVGIGILLDNFFNTRPLFIIIFFLLGGCAGILNVFRVAKSMQNH